MAIKGYIRRINILLENIKSFINLLITLVKKIKNLAIELTENLKTMSGYSKNQNFTIKEILIDPYRNISELFEEIKDIFSKFEVMESKGKKLALIMKKKLINIQNLLKNEDIGIDEIKNVNDDYYKLITKILELDINFKKEYNSIKKEETIIRIDVLIIFDITSSMEEYLIKFKNQIKNILDKLSKRCPTALIYVGFLGYVGLDDNILGEEYIDIDFRINYDKLENEIKIIEAEGRDDIPQNIAGAFEMALNKEWRGDTRISLLVTDSPWHGVGFENKRLFEQNIKEKIHQFKKENISLICFNLTKNTFENEYNSQKEKNYSLFSKIMISLKADLFKQLEIYLIITSKDILKKKKKSCKDGQKRIIFK